jgi:hypothetical protein
MVTGRKWVPLDSPAEGARPAPLWRAALLLVAAAGLVFGALSLAPGRAW